jgi:hypothetical protein
MLINAIEKDFAEIENEIINYKKDLLQIYTNITADKKIAENAVLRASEALMKKYKDKSVKSSDKITDAQYESLLNATSLVEAAMGRKTQIEAEISELSNKFTGTERIDIIRQFSKAMIGTGF